MTRNSEQFFSYSNSQRMAQKYIEDENDNKINLFEIQEYSEK